MSGVASVELTRSSGQVVGGSSRQRDMSPEFEVDGQLLAESRPANDPSPDTSSICSTDSAFQTRQSSNNLVYQSMYGQCRTKSS